MSYLKGSFTYHKPSYEPEGHPHRTCLYCGEPWPCDPAVILADVLEDERERVARFLRDFPQATHMAGHRVFDLDTVALMILRAEHVTGTGDSNAEV